MTVKRGEVYSADLSGSVGHEQTGIRPVIVIQNDKAYQNSETVIVACITITHKPSRLNVIKNYTGIDWEREIEHRKSSVC